MILLEIGSFQIQQKLILSFFSFRFSTDKFVVTCAGKNFTGTKSPDQGILVNASTKEESVVNYLDSPFRKDKRQGVEFPGPIVPDKMKIGVSNVEVGGPRVR